MLPRTIHPSVRPLHPTLANRPAPVRMMQLKTTSPLGGAAAQVVRHHAAIQVTALGGARAVCARLAARGPRTIQRLSRPGVDAVAVALQPKTGGQPLPNDVRAKMEQAFGADFADVRIHVGDEASSIGALAFTWGTHIHFARGQYNPHTLPGQKVLGHELAHVLQQKSGRVANPLGGGVAIVNVHALEVEADRMAVRSAVRASTGRRFTAVQSKAALNGVIQCVVNQATLDNAIARAAADHLAAATNDHQRSMARTWRSHVSNRASVYDRARAILMAQGISMDPRSEYDQALQEDIFEIPTVFG